MKRLLFTLIAFVSLQAFAQETGIINDPHAVTRSLPGSFTGISVSSGITLYLTQDSKEALVVSASGQKYTDRLKTEIVGSTLKIYYDNNGVTWKSSGKAELKVYLSFKTLEKLKASAGSVVLVNGTINAGDLNLDISSGAEFKGVVHAKTLSSLLNSGASASISGKADTLHVEVSSGANFKGYDLVTEYCDASANSGAGIKVTINKELNAKVSSGGDIQYKGTAMIRDIKTRSGGSVKKV